MTKKHKIFLTILVIIFLGSAGLLWAVKFNQPEMKMNSPVPLNHVFSCYYTDGKSPARCYKSGDDKISACLGYYELIGKKMEEGINSRSVGSNTCEAFEGSPEYYYDKNGKYLN